MTRTRFLTALVAIPVIVFIVQTGGWLYIFADGCIALIAVWEFVRMMQAKGHHPRLLLAQGVAVAAVIDWLWPEHSIFIPAFIFLAMAGLVWELYQQDSQAPVVDWALSLIGGAYIGLGLSYFLGLRFLPNGYVWVWLALLCTWGADTFAYFGGRMFGKRLFWPRWSPKKTWAGIIAGYAGGMFGGSIVVLIFGFPLVHALILGLLAGFFGPLGDLSISMMKRYADVKDSSNLIPGHGGMLDRVDSILFTVVVVFYYAIWVVH